jgi:integrative and conjugative element protein (TIGR02256 family)
MSSGRRVIEYPIGVSGQTLIVSDGVLQHFRKHRQRRWWHSEAGGQLFARFDGSGIIVEEETGPRRTDRRSRTSYVPDRKAEQAEIIERQARGLHFVGDWHTHAEAQPHPSRRDLSSIAECVVQSTHGLNGFLLAVVGTADPPIGLHVSIHDGITMHSLKANPSLAPSRDRLPG